MMQAIAGVHFNFSLPETFWKLWAELNGKEHSQEQTSADYFGLIRNYRRLCWLIPYLYGASPALCGSFLKGNDQKNIIIEKLSILPLICYEVIFTKFIQQADQNTNLIVNISEDGWFGDTIGPHQHFSKGIFRAIEQNSFFIRSANKGISAIINNKGEVIKKLSKSETGNIELEVPLIKSDEKNQNNLIFFILLFTYLLIYIIFNKNNEK